jgi:hypothetical protein
MTSALTLGKQRRRAEREAELGARQLALPNKRLAYPSWRFERADGQEVLKKALAGMMRDAIMQVVRENAREGAAKL